MNAVLLGEIVLRLAGALALGGALGLERSYHGRPAGFRTHALVGLASGALMLIPFYEGRWFRAADGVHAAIDPTRMAQGIMTGIGFLGAGVILHEGISVRGLTTAASIWITAAIGILAGIGFYLPLVASVALTLIVLSFFRKIETRMPTQAYYECDVRYARGGEMNESQLRELIEQHGFEIANFSYRLDGEGRVLRHRMVIRSTDRSGAGRLAHNLQQTPAILEFRIAPTGD
jgi:putative Mg2+ transporter-C (MgtC) family protein